MDEGKVEVISTETSLVEFKNSTVWKDMMRELLIWDRQAQKDYDHCKQMEDVTRIQGRREAIAYLIQLPDFLLDALIQQRKENENE